MGRDKGAIVLGGESLLERAYRALSAVCGRVMVSGLAPGSLPGATSLLDRTPGCGPLGGVVAALRFAQEHESEWVMFLPVDMPLLPVGLLHALLADWRRALARGAWVCCAEADGTVQPLISLGHTSTRPALERRLAAGDLRLRPGLEAAAVEVAAAMSGPAEGAFWKTEVRGDMAERVQPPGWRPSAEEWSRRALWFSNVNTPEELARVEALLAGAGAATRPAGMAE